MFIKQKTIAVLFFVVLAFMSGELLASEKPETFLKLENDTLQVTAGKSVVFKLNVPNSETWASAKVSQFQIRTFNTVESLLSLTENNVTTELSYRFTKPGYAMVILCAGPASAKHGPNSIHLSRYCTKILLRVTPPAGNTLSSGQTLKSPGLTAKAGIRMEIRPYIDPTSITVEALEQGADFPVRVYYDGSAQENAPVIAYGPGGIKQERTTDSKGTTRFTINREGCWLLRYQKNVEGIRYTGDLLFYVGQLNRGLAQ